jgi:hypothetical protein
MNDTLISAIQHFTIQSRHNLEREASEQWNNTLTFGQVYIEQEGEQNPFAEKRDLRSLYSPKAARVLRVLLTDPKKAWRVQALAEEAEVSLGQVSNVALFTSYDEGVLYGARQIGGICIASPVQVYLDLLGVKGRGEEAAKAILDEVIRRSW